MRVIYFAAIVAIAACTTEPVETELDQFSRAVRGTTSDVEKLLESGIASEADARLVQAGKNRDFWQLSSECRDVIAGTANFPIEACEINRKVRFPDQPYKEPAGAVARKLGVLSAYVTALDGLANAQLESDVTANFGAAVGALKDLGSAAESKKLVEMLDRQAARQDKTDAIVERAIAALRYNKLKKVVISSDAAVAELIREIQLGLIGQGLVPEYSTRAEALNTANKAAGASALSGEGHQANLVALEREHKRFAEFYKTTLVYELAVAARNHAALARALKSPGSPEDITNYLISLGELKKVLEG